MTDIQLQKFFDEVDMIRQRHVLFFPAAQKQFISIIASENTSQIKFHEGYNLPDCITLEIQLCLKMVGADESPNTIL